MCGRRRRSLRSDMDEPEDDLETHERHAAANGLRMPHPDEGHGRPEVELHALLDEVKRAEREVAPTLNDENNSPDVA